MAGLSEKQIGLAINLEKRFVDKPALHDALIEGEISINKLTRVASVATKENEGILMESAKQLSKSGLDVLVKDIKMAQEKSNRNGLFEGQNRVKSLPGQNAEAQRRRLGGYDNNGTADDNTEGVPANANNSNRNDNTTANINTLIELGLSGEVIEKLKALKGKGLDVNGIILESLEKREEELKERKLKQSAKVGNCELKRKAEGKKPSRYLASETKKILKEEYGTKCSVPGCKRGADHLHHTARFALTGSNDSRFLAPLCREHHEIAHLIDRKVVNKKIS